MKTTIELPDELVTEIKIEAARERKKLKELMPELVRAGLRVRREPQRVDREAAAKWLDDWGRLGEAATRDRPGPTATEILAADRGRLDRR
jgi:hypothetical protein